MEAILMWLGVHKAAVIGGFVGGAASLRLHAAPTLTDKACNVGFGWGAAAFATPLIVEYFALGGHLMGGAAFFIGLLALPTLVAFVKAIPDWIAGARAFIFRGGSNGNVDR